MKERFSVFCFFSLVYLSGDHSRLIRVDSIKLLQQLLTLTNKTIKKKKKKSVVAHFGGREKIGGVFASVVVEQTVHVVFAHPLFPVHKHRLAACIGKSKKREKKRKR
jgi:hypothetical protein